jgi:hypothetical protein
MAPAAAQQALDCRRWLIAGAQPNDLWWRAEERRPLGEVGVLRDQNEPMLSSIAPDGAIIGFRQADQPTWLEPGKMSATCRQSLKLRF